MKTAIDLRSDTVTKPCQAMRNAMACAEVGDDVYREDPTVRKLEEHVANLLGKEAALFVTSGTMGNQVAINLLTQPGDGVLVGRDSHIAHYEAGAAGFVSGVQLDSLPGAGLFCGKDVAEHFQDRESHGAQTRVVAVENTHNSAGGVVWSREQLDDVLNTADALGLAKHLDGARLWNASIATQQSERQLANRFDTVSVCLSKGLGAPVGSVLAASKDLITEALRVRKRLGGAMRQAGILAAAALHALEHHRTALTEDHANAALLAGELAKLNTLEVNQPTTNIVLVTLPPTHADAAAFTTRAKDRGLLFWPAGKNSLRLVTHRDVDREACKRAVDIFASLCG